ncbi:MAG: glycosyltransferase family 2 protein [Pyrinomonadaceae bacterium]
MPFFSVVIPTFNRASFIAKSVESVLAQDFDDFEVLVIDDGSTDNTAEVMRERFAADARVKYFRQPNMERGAARNHGFRKALGQYVLFLDSDDLMHSDHLRTLMEVIETHPGINFLATKFRILRNGDAQSSDLQNIKEGWHGLNLFLKGAPVGSVVCVNKSNPNLKLFEEDRSYAILEDWMFLVQNLARDRIYIRDEFTVSVIDHAGRSMRSDNQAIINKKLLARDWIIKNIELTEDQIRTLDGYAYQFCAIHSYLDGNKKKALGYLFRATQRTGFDAKLATLSAKALVGYEFIQKIKHASAKINFRRARNADK